MIIRMLSAGKSFSGLSAYLNHDPAAKTAERVGWTHTLNLAHDHVPSAVDEMLWTARNAELLKQEAGIRAGGRETENAVKHLSLNWGLEDDPSREHMIEATQDFLRHMNWQDHQAVLVAHTDRAYSHVHIMLSTIHPETGLQLDDSFERRRAQTWARDYEEAQGRTYCEQRFKMPEEREDAPTRPAWMAFQQSQIKFEREEINLGANETFLSAEANNWANFQSAEWQTLKDLQRTEREGFFADGKKAFSEIRTAVYREVREEYRERWSEFYAAKKDGADKDTLAEIKTQLVADQKVDLETRRDAACLELRETRNGLYRELLDDQRDARADLRWRQEANLDNTLFFDLLEQKQASQDIGSAFLETANAITTPQQEATWEPVEEADAFAGWGREPAHGLKSTTNMGADVGIGIGFAGIFLFGGIADSLVGAEPNPEPRRSEPKTDPGAARLRKHDLVIAETQKRETCEQEDADREWRRKQRSDYGE